MKILQDLILYDYDSFMDNMDIKGLMSWYNDEEIFSRVHQFIVEHIQSLNKILVYIEKAGYMISRVKFQFCMDRIKIIGYICRAEGRSLDIAKVIKILEWRLCMNVTEARVFIGVCVYYRI